MSEDIGMYQYQMGEEYILLQEALFSNQQKKAGPALEKVETQIQQIISGNSEEGTN